MKATILTLAVVVVLAAASQARAQCPLPYPCPSVPQAPQPGPIYPYPPGTMTQWYGPYYNYYPPFAPFQGMVVVPARPNCGAGGAFPSHQWARSPRDFFMWE